MMAVLTASELAELRNGVAVGVAVGWTKAQVNAALQAIEDYMETTAKPGVAAAIETAAPGIFNAARKKALVAYWFRQKFFRESA